MIDRKPSDVSYDWVKDKSAENFEEKYDQMFTLSRFPLFSFTILCR